jgi:hypothetical protein
MMMSETPRSSDWFSVPWSELLCCMLLRAKAARTRR